MNVVREAYEGLPMHVRRFIKACENSIRDRVKAKGQRDRDTRQEKPQAEESCASLLRR
jgi:hypothetical protein